MANPIIKPATDLTKAQWKRFLERLLKKEPQAAKEGLLPERIASKVGEEGEINQRVMDEVLSKNPPATKEMGMMYPRLTEEEAEAQMFSKPEYFPIAEARAKYQENPEAWQPVNRPPKEVKQIQTVEPGAEEDLAGGSLAEGIAYHRLKFQPIEKPTKKQSVQNAQTQIAKGASELPGGAGEVVDQPVKQALADAVMADQLWKEMGGARSTAGRLWETMRSQQRGGIQQAFKTGRDYFLASYGKYKRNPIEYGRKFPKEAGLLEKITKLTEEESK